MDVKYATSLTAGTTLQDKVKLLSCVEMNFSSFASNMPGYNSSYRNIEGEPYTYFTAGAWNADNDSRVVYGGKYTGTNSATPYLLRTKSISSGSSYNYHINSTGKCPGAYNAYNYYTILPVLRL